MMKATRIIYEAMVQAFNLDTAGLHDAGDNRIAISPIVQPFAYDPAMTIANVSLGTSGFRAAPEYLVKQQTSTKYDPTTGEDFIWPTPGAGRTDIEASGGAYPVTVFGYALLGVGATVLWAVQAFDSPIVLTANEQFIFTHQKLFQFPFSMIS